MTDLNITEIANEEIEKTTRLERIFIPRLAARRAQFLGEELRGGLPARFVHYTSADSALKILESKELWLRDTKCMDDYMEMRHGFELLRSFFTEEKLEKEFIAALDQVELGAAQDAIKLFNQWWADVGFDVFLASMSEHSESEDFHGRLSMWRAFGGGASSVALVFKLPMYSRVADNLSLQLNPVMYSEILDGQKMLQTVIKNVKEELEYLKNIGHEQLVKWIFALLLSGVTCSKHVGFREEREWRVIHIPKMWPSKDVTSNIETIRGIPQTIFKVPLSLENSDIADDLKLAKILDRIIIGPSQFAVPLKQTFTQILEKLGVENASEKVFISGIPVRT